MKINLVKLGDINTSLTVDGVYNQISLNTKLTKELDGLTLFITTCFFGNKVGPERKMEKDELNYKRLQT